MDPLTLAIIGAALTAGGYGAKAIGQGQIDSARADAQMQENLRQRLLDTEAYDLANRSQDRYKGMDEQRRRRIDDVAQFYTDTAGAVTGDSVMPATDSTITVQEQGKQGRKAAAFNNQQRRAQADVRSFGDFLGTAARGAQRDSSDIGSIAGFKRGSSAVLPLELEAANGAGAGMQLLGDLLAGAGQVGLSAGLSGSLAPAASSGNVSLSGVRTTAPSRVGGFGRLAGPV